MTHVEARRILSILGGSLTPEKVKEAYRHAALKAHPDQGGTVQDFLKIQAAYEFLMGGGIGVSWGETTEELEKRLEAIAKAFDHLKAEFGIPFGKEFDLLTDRLTVSMKALDSTRRIERNWPGIVQSSWQGFHTSVHDILSLHVDGIGRSFDHWLASEMRNTLHFARQQYLKGLSKNPLLHLSALALSGTVGFMIYRLLPASSFSWWFLPILLPSGYLLVWSAFSHYANSKYSEETVIPKLGAHHVQLKDSNVYYNLGGIWTKEESGGAGLISGAGIGFMVGGPAGAVVGGIIGSIAGAILGTPIGDVQEAIFQDTLNNLFPLAEELFSTLQNALEDLKKEYLKQARENYKKASRKAVLLLAGK
jgi:gas vesicle protein